MDVPQAAAKVALWSLAAISGLSGLVPHDFAVLSNIANGTHLDVLQRARLLRL